MKHKLLLATLACFSTALVAHAREITGTPGSPRPLGRCRESQQGYQATCCFQMLQPSTLMILIFTP